MRKWVVLAAALVGLLLCASAFADPGNGKGTNKDNDTHVQLLAINDFHGHIQASTPGTIRYVDSQHSLTKLRKYSAIDFEGARP